MCDYISSLFVLYSLFDKFNLLLLEFVEIDFKDSVKSLILVDLVLCIVC